MTTISREYINDNFWHNTIIINTGNSSGVDFNISKEQRNNLYLTGYNTALEIVPMKTKNDSLKNS